MKRAILTAAVILAAIAPLACGGGDDNSGDEDQILATLDTVDTAIHERDIETFCESSSPAYVKDLGGQAKCVSGFEKDILFVPGPKAVDMVAEKVDIEGKDAVVTLDSGFTVNFVKDGDTWYFAPFAPPRDLTVPPPILDPSDVPTTPSEG